VIKTTNSNPKITGGETEPRHFESKLPSAEARCAAGKELRTRVPRESHARWQPGSNRPDPIEILIASNKRRLPDLVPIRHARMLTSPFAFFRGSAAVMASDLSLTPATGLRVQACGDCHLMNFGGFGTPERQMNFSINDFDETLPAPWEWDLKRLAASFVIAGRYINLKEREALAAAHSAVLSYRRRMASFAEMNAFDLWYHRVDIAEVLAAFPEAAKKRLEARIEKVRARSVAEHDFPKLAESDGVNCKIKHAPPLICQLPTNERAGAHINIVEALKAYRETLADHRRVLLDRFHLQDFAIKVVGVGSVGTECYIALFMAADNDPLFLQAKQANASVLEPYAGRSHYSNHGERVVKGQRLMQSASDIMLGWTAGTVRGLHYYVRQLHDMKVSPIVETMEPETLSAYGKLCGWTLARAHARSGDAAMISGYLGRSDEFDQAIVKFATAYADQTESDYELMREAARTGRLEVASTE
jgi:uncharacterized protein (DUF2252 family)